METISCPICYSQEYNSFETILDRINKDISFNVVKCKCSFIYLNPRPNSKDIKQYYDNENYLPHSNSISFASKIYSLAQRFSFFLKYSYISKLFKNRKLSLLDIGSGKGEFCTYMSKKKWTTQEYEPFVKDSNTLIGGNQKFSLITMWHSLEHIHNINEIFTLINKHLIDDGYLLIAVPNINAHERKYFKNKWIAYDAPRHLYHFSPHSMGNILSKYGFTISSYKPLYQDTFFNIIGSYPDLKVYNFFHAGYCAFMSLLLSIFDKNKSSSIIYICKKN